MIDKIQIVKNEIVTVAYSFVNEGVVVVGTKNGKQKAFGGWGAVRDLFFAFSDSISEETTYEDAIKFFTPQIGNLQL